MAGSNSGWPSDRSESQQVIWTSNSPFITGTEHHDQTPISAPGSLCGCRFLRASCAGAWPAGTDARRLTTTGKGVLNLDGRLSPDTRHIRIFASATESLASGLWTPMDRNRAGPSKQRSRRFPEGRHGSPRPEDRLFRPRRAEVRKRLSGGSEPPAGHRRSRRWRAGDCRPTACRRPRTFSMGSVLEAVNIRGKTL